MTARVGIVLINFEGHADTIECLESILKSTYPHYQIVIVDNSASDLSLRAIQRWINGESRGVVTTLFPELIYPLAPKPLRHRRYVELEFRSLNEAPSEDVLLVKSDQNYGFAGGNNIAIEYFLKYPEFEFIWLLNNDTVIRKDALVSLIEFANHSGKRTGIIGSKLFLYYAQDMLQAVAGRYYAWLGVVKELGYGKPDTGEWDNNPFSFDYVVGASMFVRREFILETGSLSEDYFLYFEELDWAIRGKRKGWNLGFCKESMVYHKAGASINRSEVRGKSAISDFYSIRNRILITRKYYPLAMPVLYGAFIKFVMNRIRLKQFSRIRMLLAIVANPHKRFNEKTPGR